MPDLNRTLSQTTIPLNIKNRSHRFKNLTGKRFGKLTVIGLNRISKNKTHWLCKCYCGCFSIVERSKLTMSRTKSCGCLIRENVSRRNFKHGFSFRLFVSPEYNVWRSMKFRCYNKLSKDFKRYGGRGIKVCKRWRNSFRFFISDMGLRPSPRHSIDRINNDGNYEPGNVRWASRTEQARNTATNHRLTFNGETRSMAEWSDLLGLSYFLIRSRLNSGWSVERALTEPKHEPAKDRYRPRFGARGDEHWTRQDPSSVKRGEAHGEAKLTSDDVLQIRALYHPRVMGYKALALRFGVSKTLIEKIVKREAWRHLS